MLNPGKTSYHQATLLRPDWSLLKLGRVVELPAARWKLENIQCMTSAKRRHTLDRLRAILYRDGHV